MIDKLSEAEKQRLIEMAWEDRTSFKQIEYCYGLSEQETISFMRSAMSKKDFNRWRERVSGRKTKHEKLLEHTPTRAYASVQYKYLQNRKRK